MAHKQRPASENPSQTETDRHKEKQVEIHSAQTAQATVYSSTFPAIPSSVTGFPKPHSCEKNKL